MEEKTVTITINKNVANELYDVIGRLNCAYDYARDNSHIELDYVDLFENPRIFKSEAAAMVELWEALCNNH